MSVTHSRKGAESIARLFPVMPRDRTRDNGQKLNIRYIRKQFISIRVMEHWHRLVREAVEFPALEVF